MYNLTYIYSIVIEKYEEITTLLFNRLVKVHEHLNFYNLQIHVFFFLLNNIII